MKRARNAWKFNKPKIVKSKKLYSRKIKHVTLKPRNCQS